MQLLVVAAGTLSPGVVVGGWERQGGKVLYCMDVWMDDGLVNGEEGTEAGQGGNAEE